MTTLIIFYSTGMYGKFYNEAAAGVKKAHIILLVSSNLPTLIVVFGAD